MNEILKLIYKKYLINSSIRGLYNLKITSWKFLLIINFILMFISFAVDDSSNFVIKLSQAFFSGTFISILTYVVTIVIPERMRVKRIIKTLIIDMEYIIFPIFADYSLSDVDKLKFFLDYSIFPKLTIVESSLGMISREVGVQRCIYSEYDGSLFNSIQDFKNNLQALNKMLDVETLDEKMIVSTLKKITEIYWEELIPTCKKVEKYYFIDWEDLIKYKIF